MNAKYNRKSANVVFFNVCFIVFFFKVFLVSLFIIGRALYFSNGVIGFLMVQRRERGLGYVLSLLNVLELTTTTTA